MNVMENKSVITFSMKLFCILFHVFKLFLGTSIERMCEIIAANPLEYTRQNRSPNIISSMSCSSKSLIDSITRVLLLADIIVVKQLLLSKEKASKGLDKLESVFNFSEFVRAFSVFGSEMIELAYLTGDRQNKLKEEKRRAEIFIARQILERSTVILLTSSKTCLLHSECTITKENRDTIFCQIRRAMDLIHFVVKDRIIENTTSCLPHPDTQINDWVNRETLYFALINFTRLLSTYKQKNDNKSKFILNGINDMKTDDKSGYSKEDVNIAKNFVENNDSFLYKNCITSSVNRLGYENNPDHIKNPSYNVKLNPVSNEILLLAMEKVVEKTEDFTDSAYTSHETRENILLLCERCKLELNQCIRIAMSLDTKTFQCSSNLCKIDNALENVLGAVKDLSDQLISSVSDQVIDLNHSLKMTLEILVNCRSYAINQELDRLHSSINCFHDYCDHILDVCKLFQHVAATYKLQIQAKFSESNMRVYGPQVINAARILSIFPSSTVAAENFDAFFAMWKCLATDVTILCEQIIGIARKQELIDNLKCFNSSQTAVSITFL